MSTYWGQEEYINYIGSSARFFISASKRYTCAGSGPQKIVSLEGYGQNFNTPPHDICAALYDYSGRLVVRGNVAKAPSDLMEWIAWGEGELTWANGYTRLIGGTDYRLAVVLHNANVRFKTYEVNAWQRCSTTPALPPDSLSGLMWTGINYSSCVRCAVDPLANVPASAHNFRMRRAA